MCSFLFNFYQAVNDFFIGMMTSGMAANTVENDIFHVNDAVLEEYVQSFLNVFFSFHGLTSRPTVA